VLFSASYCSILAIVNKIQNIIENQSNCCIIPNIQRLEIGNTMSEIQSLARGIRILNMLFDSVESISVTEVAEVVDIDKSSASRLLRTLEKYEYIQRENGSRRYVLGHRITRMGWELINRMPIRDQAKPFLFDLMNQTGECAHTAIYSQGQALVIDDVEVAASLRVPGVIGRKIPLHCTAVGKSLLAFSYVPVPEELPARTIQTITDRADLLRHLQHICKQGYAVDYEENDYGVCCIAAPVYDYTGKAIATIGISGPTVRVTHERIPGLGQMVVEAGKKLSAHLGAQR
jgi:DNA-binding IclR family transcriptional regulator